MGLISRSQQWREEKGGPKKQASYIFRRSSYIIYLMWFDHITFVNSWQQDAIRGSNKFWNLAKPVITLCWTLVSTRFVKVWLMVNSFQLHPIHTSVGDCDGISISQQQWTNETGNFLFKFCQIVSKPGMGVMCTEKAGCQHKYCRIKTHLAFFYGQLVIVCLTELCWSLLLSV